MTYINSDAWNSKHLKVGADAGHESEELLTILVPLEAIEAVVVEIIHALEAGTVT